MPLPLNESWRLQSLLRYQILDTPPEQEYTDLVRLAAYICQVPTALVSLVDQNRQWFKARVGLDACETSRDVAFCAHAILQPNKIMVVPDATQDPRFCDNPLVVKDPNLRFYAGCPLVTPQGVAIGTLCVIDYQPRQLSAAQLEALASLSRQVVSLLEMRLAHQAEQRIDQLRTHLITLIAHEFRTPLGVISSSSGILEDYSDRLSDADRRKHHQRIRAAIATITRLIDEAVALDSLDQGQLTPTPVWCDAQAIVQSLGTTVEKLYGRPIHYQGPPAAPSVAVFTDSHRLEQLALTLLIHSIQHSPHPLHVSLTRDENTLRLHIAAQEIGTPTMAAPPPPLPMPAHIGSLAGMGIGLAYGQRLADFMGWRLNWHGGFDQVMVITLQIPLGAATEEA